MPPCPSIFISGLGAVTPAGWGMTPFREAIARGESLPEKDLARPGWNSPIRVRQVPPPSPRPPFLAHARLRRTSPIAHYAVAAALEAVGPDAAEFPKRGLRMGIVLCVMSACVNYSRRFYDEVLKQPATASPLVFPETVFNSPASHLGALLGTTCANYTLVGDPGTFLIGLALAADWLTTGQVDGCVVVGAEEMDWLTADAMKLFSRETAVSDGAGAICLKTESAANPSVRLDAVTDPQLFVRQTRAEAARRNRAQLNGLVQKNNLLCDGLIGAPRADRDELAAWNNWTGPRLSPKKIFGEGLVAAAAWQCIAAADALQRNQCDSATVSVVGCNQQAIAAQFTK